MRVELAGRQVAVDFGEEIDRGVALLNRHDPRWFDEINLDKLELSSPDRCVLGQLAMSLFRDKIAGNNNYYGVIEYLAVAGDTDNDEDGDRFGFSMDLAGVYDLLALYGVDAPNPRVIRGDRQFARMEAFYAKIWESLTLQWVARIEQCRAEAAATQVELELAGGPTL